MPELSDNNASLGIVYVLTNPAMPGLVKIGKTSRQDVEIRLNELYTTGVPVPFECAYAGRVKDEHIIERDFHLAFGPYRVNPKREFFEIEPEQAIALLRHIVVEDVTPMIKEEADRVDQASKRGSNKLKARRPNLDFLEMGIPIGSLLQMVPEPSINVEVTSNRKVKYLGEEGFLSNITGKILGADYNVNPGKNWLFEGRLLSDIYNETYELP
ncbi:GIY-YIG nuclease family protein [Alteromonas sp. CYL-A6]|uniref:GIY-YIG nuclease family protein n=1 Tax=Alteromonas nitratireducens TaxID=3390813 RepID=UPI0034C2D021